jgi:hypothetical protein
MHACVHPYTRAGILLAPRHSPIARAAQSAAPVPAAAQPIAARRPADANPHPDKHPNPLHLPLPSSGHLPLPVSAMRLHCPPPPAPTDFCAAVGLATMALGYAASSGLLDSPTQGRLEMLSTNAALAWTVWRAAALNARVLRRRYATGGGGGGGCAAGAARRGADAEADAGAALAALAWGASGAELVDAVDSQVSACVVTLVVYLENGGDGRTWGVWVFPCLCACAGVFESVRVRRAACGPHACARDRVEVLAALVAAPIGDGRASPVGGICACARQTSYRLWARGFFAGVCTVISAGTCPVAGCSLVQTSPAAKPPPSCLARRMPHEFI